MKPKLWIQEWVILGHTMYRFATCLGDKMRITADAVVIGGGVMGASITFHLAKLGLKVICVEKSHLASGATGKSSAIVRMHYDNEPEVRMAFASLPYFQNWKDIVGAGDCGFRVTGFLRLVDPEDCNKLKVNVSMMQDIGVNTQVINREEVREIAPTFSTEDIEIAAWEPESGYADPCGTTFGFLTAAERMGAILLCPSNVTGIKIKAGKITGVETSGGIISTGIVINAGGAFAGRVAEMAGCKIPVSPIRYQAGIFRRPLEIETPHPVVIDRLTGQFYFRPDDAGHTVVGGIGAKRGIDPENFNETTDPGYSSIASSMLDQRMPGMKRAVFRGGRAACDGVSDDQYAIIDKFPEVEGFYCAVGHSGHGFKIAPAVGICMAELITEGRAKTVDISPFRLSRFAEGINPFKNPNLYGERGQ
jgi:sarcosine oxidase subunit beta